MKNDVFAKIGSRRPGWRRKGTSTGTITHTQEENDDEWGMETEDRMEKGRSDEN
jgi:hypothetical protein